MQLQCELACLGNHKHSIVGKDKTQAQQKRYRYTGKERDDSSGLCYYGARYLAPWLARWISSNSAGAVDGLKEKQRSGRPIYAKVSNIMNAVYILIMNIKIFC
jgi:RHS repeat-associated protein